MATYGHLWPLMATSSSVFCRKTNFTKIFLIKTHLEENSKAIQSNCKRVEFELERSDFELTPISSYKYLDNSYKKFLKYQGIGFKIP